MVAHLFLKILGTDEMNKLRRGQRCLREWAPNDCAWRLTVLGGVRVYSLFQLFMKTKRSRKHPFHPVQLCFYQCHMSVVYVRYGFLDGLTPMGLLPSTMFTLTFVCVGRAVTKVDMYQILVYTTKMDVSCSGLFGHL